MFSLTLPLMRCAIMGILLLSPSCSLFAQNTRFENYDLEPDQYLKYAEVPEVELKFTSEGKNDWLIQYRWNVTANGFNIPVSVTKTKNEWSLIYPNANWQQIHLKDVKPADFRVDTENFYITVKREQPSR